MATTQAASTTPAQSKASRTNSASESRRKENRHRQPSRGSQRLKFDSAEMHDLILASTNVPTGRIDAYRCCDKVRFESDVASTAVPSSVEQSPELSVSPSDWPSLEKTSAEAAGWELCSDASDFDALPSPAIDVEDDGFPEPNLGLKANRWWLLGDDDADRTPPANSENFTTRPTFAEVLRREKSGNDLPSQNSRTSRQRDQSRQRKPIASGEDDLEDTEHDYVDRQRWHGWKGEHKKSRNWKQQLKVEASKTKRYAQSWRSRGWTSDEF